MFRDEHVRPPLGHVRGKLFGRDERMFDHPSSSPALLTGHPRLMFEQPSPVALLPVNSPEPSPSI